MARLDGERNNRFLRRWLVGLVAISVAAGAFAAPPTPAERSAFLELPKIYLKWKITETGTRQFETASTGLTDIAYRIDRSAKGVLPLNMPMPGSYPMSSMPLSMEQMTEAGRFTGWMAVPPDDAANAMEQMMAGQVDVAHSPTFVPVDYVIDDTVLSRYRDFPTTGWATETRTTKGSGKVYSALSGMMMCDLKKLTCDINNVPFAFNEGAEKVTTTTNSDVPGFESRTEQQTPQNHLPKLPSALVARLSGIPIKLPLPMTVTFSEPAANENLPAGSAPGDHAPVVTLELTLAAAP
jgi:hypothetical protein